MYKMQTKKGHTFRRSFGKVIQAIVDSSNAWQAEYAVYMQQAKADEIKTEKVKKKDLRR